LLPQDRRHYEFAEREGRGRKAGLRRGRTAVAASATAAFALAAMTLVLGERQRGARDADIGVG